MFRITHIVRDPSLDFIQSPLLDRLHGQNIFEARLSALQKRLQAEYPQVEHLRIIREFPDQVRVTAQKREPFAAVRVDGRNVVIDREGVALAFDPQLATPVPFIDGIAFEGPVVIGRPLRHGQLDVFLRIIRAFRDEAALRSYHISAIHVESMSKIYVSLSDGIQVILDQDGIEQKVGKLAILLTRGHLDMKRVNYIDLRFKEPVLGKK